MKRVRIFISAFAGLALLCPVLSKDEADWKLPSETARLKPGPGAEFATANCLLCHSADYISMQPPLDRAGWLALVQKMREKYGAPIPADKMDGVADYLARAYGK